MILRFQNRTLVVADKVIERTLQLAARAARSPSPVLLCGESGTGKELIARYIHEKGARSDGPFVSVNCAAIPEGLLEAELFGFERGAFTGAVAQRIGKFERASGGTLLLDEISEMPLSLQAKLLRVFQENEIDRLGGKDPVRLDTRIIATTNRDPWQLVQDKLFREDLFYRLHVIRIDCSPLRGRKEAFQNLVLHFLKQAARTHGKEMIPLSNEAVRRMEAYSWPGNVRELQNAIERAVFLSDGGELGPEHFDFLKAAESVHAPCCESLEEIERQHILSVLQKAGGNRTQAAQRLGITARTLRNKLGKVLPD
ncbi:MAG: sigma-54-dependent Fis family transcriptional regulator [Deltaproteobacteria bacterium]|nr:sigma-54-dependent Fis family transcriptional regulator [Deltaproteobacteria bacterium]